MERRVLIIATGILVVLPAVAWSRSPVHPAALDPSWRDLAFGSPREEVLRVLERRIRDRYGDLTRKTMDIRERDRLSREMQKEIEEVRASKVVFPAGQSTWSVSILRDDYEPGQEMILVREGAARYYLLFHEGTLYKWIVTPADPSREAAMTLLEQAFGPPAEVEKSPDGEVVVRARWTDEGPLCASLQDYTREFQTVLVRVAKKDLEEKFRAARKARQGTTLNPLIDASKETPQVQEPDPVDELIGRQGPVPHLRDQPAKKKKKGK